ncbi:MAG TPA: hypothetical protein VF168_08830 [Trueperaceae bacterium]
MKPVCLALLLCSALAAAQSTAVDSTAADSTAAPVPAITSARLIERFEQRLREAEGSDVTAIAAELERMRAAGSARLRFTQRSDWEFGERLDLGFGASLSWSLLDPEAELQRALTAKRLELARHDQSSRRADLVREFERTLRLVVHLEAAEELLARHRQQLLESHPGWRSLDEVALGESDDEGTSGRSQGSGLDAQRIGYLELEQALARTRRERSLLLLAVAEQAGVDPNELSTASFELPAAPAVDPEVCVLREPFETSETIRAELLLEESLLAQRLDDAVRLTQVTLDLSGNARHSGSSEARRGWSGNLRLALQVALPAGESVGSDLSLAITPGGLSQELSIGWPAPNVESPGSADEATSTYSRMVESARLDALRDLMVLYGARERLRLREAELAVARRASLGSASDLSLLNDAAQAELALLNAQLELDLALMAVAAHCPERET